ncbi:MAG TPA: hypothetical protein VFC47_12180 [Caulobacteraceae bacterium]|nr:hypothetical protein [Caulobacteraceae bacterium]
MTGTILPAIVLRAVDANGAPISGAQLQFYLTGTTTPTPVYTDKTLGTPLANPVVADGGGLFAPIFLDPAVTYRARLLNTTGGLISDNDPVGGPLTIAAGSISAADLAAGAALANLGYTPLNRAGDTATNLILAASTIGAASAGYLGAPVNEQDSAYTLTLGDAGKLIRSNSGSAMAITIPPNSAVAYPAGTCIAFRNAGAGVVTITRGSGVAQTLAGAGTSKDVALAQYGLATLVQESANTWVISGSGIS